MKSKYIDKDQFIALMLTTGNEKVLKNAKDITPDEIERVRKLLQATNTLKR